MNEESDCDWQTKNEKICQRGRYLLESGIWSDCKFIVGSELNIKEFKAHKLILSMASPVFATMFNNESFQETDVKILDVQPDAFLSFLKYIYTDDLTISSFDQACELCYVANKYMMPILVRSCSSYIWKDVSFKNVCRAYEFSLLFDQESLKKKCIQIICTETENVLRHPSFVDVELPTLHMILEQDELFISSELELFSAVISWANQEFVRRGVAGEENIEIQREIAEPLLSKIRFLLMTPVEFAEGPAQNPLLTQEQKFAILMNISSKKAGLPMPEKFSNDTKHRNYQIKHKTSFYLCKPDLVKDKPVKSIGMIETYLIFSCHRDLKIYGVQMMSQMKKDQQDTDYNKMFGLERQSEYRENMYMQLEEVIQGEGLNCWIPISGKIESASFKEIVKYNKLIEVKFTRPGRVCKGRHYKLAVALNVPGLYVRWTLNNPTTVSHTCIFNFHPIDFFESGIFFQAILFTA